MSGTSRTSIIWRTLLESGYLPEVLPPNFQTAQFMEFVVNRPGEEFIGQPRRNSMTRAVDYHSTKRGNSRRTFAFPHPETFHDISLFLAKNWNQIETHFRKSTYSRSVPNLTMTDFRAVKITAHQELTVMLYRELSQYRFVVKTDVSRFYPSIYTHSIPWSIHGKAASKADRKPDSATVNFNRLDELLRAAQDGQTVGLPVGPDTSRIVAEIVAVAVDEVFKAKSSGRTFALIRHVDDVWIGATSYSEAESLLYIFRECLREFELDINELKTSITESARALEPIWPLSLKRLIHDDFQALKAEDKTRVLSDIFRLAQDEKDDGILKYAIRRFDRERMWAQHWDILQSFLMRAVISFPHTIDYVARVLSWTKRKGVNIDTQWRGALLDAFERNSNLGNDSEVCWLLWCMSELELGIPDELIDVLLARCGAFPIVMFLHITRTGRRRRTRFRRVLRDAVVDRIGPNPFMGPYWLLAHEAVNSKWLDIANLDQTDLSPFMREVQAAGVSFYDREARPLSIREDESGDEEEPFAIEDMAGRYDDDEDDDDDDDDDDDSPEDNDIPI